MFFGFSCIFFSCLAVLSLCVWALVLNSVCVDLCVSDSQGLGRWEEEGLTQTLGLLWEHRPAQGGHFLTWLQAQINNKLQYGSWSILNPLFLSMPPLTLMSVCALFRSPNCVSSYSAANAAAAIGGTKSARPLSMAATPLSNRRWLIETACRLEEDCVGYPIWVFEDVPLSRCPYLAPVCVWCRRMYTFSGHSCHSTVCDRDGSRATHTFLVESVAIQLSCILDVLEENEWLAQI